MNVISTLIPLLTTVRPAAAQTGAAVSVTGVVPDQARAVLPGATVDLLTTEEVVV